MTKIGKILIVLGLGITLWAVYQYVTNQPSSLPEKPRTLSEGVQALGDLYSNIFDKAEKQAEAKDIGAIGAIVIFIGCGLLFIGRKDTKSRSDA